MYIYIYIDIYIYIYIYIHICRNICMVPSPLCGTIATFEIYYPYLRWNIHIHCKTHNIYIEIYTSMAIIHIFTMKYTASTYLGPLGSKTDKKQKVSELIYRMGEVLVGYVRVFCPNSGHLNCHMEYKSGFCIFSLFLMTSVFILILGPLIWGPHMN